MKNQLWVEKYRPKTVDGYVFTDENQKNQVENWIKEGSFPHLLMSGDPGTGKTTLAKLLIHELGVEEYDVLTKDQWLCADYAVRQVQSCAVRRG
jgi:Holliday junction resolvasome RuvABC ATP-dependent DNA helicase subunit